LVIYDLFKGTVRRFDERIRFDSLKDVIFDAELIKELGESFDECCRYMEGHSHSDKFSALKPTSESLRKEIDKFKELKAKIKNMESQS
jgi:hypothetical protein